MRTIVNLYKNNQDTNIFLYINYIENESNYKTKRNSGLGEPKFNINGTPYNKPWGRPQNDGPVFHGIVLFELFDLFNINIKL